jgi:hypothetical protein
LNDDNLHSTFLMFGSFPISVSHCELIVICEKRCYHWIRRSRYHPTRIVRIHSCSYSFFFLKASNLTINVWKTHERVSLFRTSWDSKNKKRLCCAHFWFVCGVDLLLLLLNYMANTPRPRLMCPSLLKKNYFIIGWFGDQF